jgi:oligopeptide/dipeptide ABC transporter ATP-binding protein
MTVPEKLLEVRDLKVHFPIQKGVLRRVAGYVKAVDGVSFTIHAGETLGLVGESGCGKTTTGRAILRILKPTGGQIVYHSGDGSSVDLAGLDNRALRPYRRDIRMIFQDPQSSLNPRLPVMEIVGQCLRANGIAHGRELEDRVAELLRKVGLRPEYLRRYPHAFSGGERQRIGIARALALHPRLIVADEAVSALDVSVQAQTLNLLQDLQQEFSLTYLFVAHDLSVVEHISDRVAVMYCGRIVELAPTDNLFACPMHPYTEALLSAVPVADPRMRGKRARIRLAGEVADPASPPSGCAFHPRCGYADARCRTEVPALREVSPGHVSACHYAESIPLTGIVLKEAS